MESTALGDDSKVYRRYEPGDSGYFHWTAQWPSDEWHCGYPVLEGAEVIELTDGEYGKCNGHNTTTRIDGHLFIGHNNHAHHSENSSGQRCLGWIYKLGDPWKRSSFNKQQGGEAIDLFPPPAPMTDEKFSDDARYFGTPQFHQLKDGRIMAHATVVTIRRGTKANPTGRVNTWAPVCTLARTITPTGELGQVQLIRIQDQALYDKAVAAGYLKHPDGRAREWVEDLIGSRTRDGIAMPPYKTDAADGYRAAEFRDAIWIDRQAGRAVCMGRGENAEGVFRGYTTTTDDSGENWSTPEPTNIPSGENTITLTRLPDGRMAILGTFGDRSRSDRRPLCIAISEDGRNFSQVYRLSESKERHQMVGVVFDEKYMYVAGPHRSHGNAGRGEHFVLRLPLAKLPGAREPHGEPMNLRMTGQTSAKGTAVVDMWAAPMPDPDKPAAGFPVLERAEHTKVYHATKEKGGYSHHAQLIVHDGVFYAMWSNHPHGEDSPGQFVRFSYSRDGRAWAEPQRLFPPYADFKPFRALGPFGTAQAGGWIIHEGKLYGLMGILDTVGFANTDRSSTREKRDHEHKFRVKRFLGVVARSVELAEDEPTLSQPFELPDDRALGLDADQPLTRELAALEGRLRDTAEALAEARRARSPWSELEAVDSPRPVEPTFYRAADGKWVCLMRDDAYSHRMYVSVSEDGDDWPPARPTNIPDSPSLSETVGLADGKVLLIGNHVAPEFDNWNEVSHYNRDPMTVAVSPDGYRFTRAYALRTGSPDHRVQGVGGRGRGAQYPSAVVHDGRLHVLYSMGKEDVWISSVPIAEIESGD